MDKTLLMFKQVMRESHQTAMALFRIMVPALIVLKIIESLGWLSLLGEWLGPSMSVVGLPFEMGIVWVTSMFTSMYAAMIVLVNLNVDLSVAQVTILSCMMLISHSLPIEAVIARQIGVALWATLLVRIGGSFLLGWILHHSFTLTDTLQQPAQILWQPEPPDDSLWQWVWVQIEGLALVYVIIAVLMLTLKILAILHIERLISLLFSPFLKVLGIGRAATNMTIIGMTLGLAFGGGLLLNEARKGTVQPRDIFTAVMLLNLFHSLIEDTLVLMLIGADFNTMLWGRAAFAFVLVAMISWGVRALGDSTCRRFLYRSVSQQPLTPATNPS